jgi:membrane protease YdiL (CAAX protease family)
MSWTSPEYANDRRLYGRSPCYPELAAVALAGLVHVLLEFAVTEAVALWFSAGVALAFLAYLVWRAKSGAVVLRGWGMRVDNFWTALRAQLVLGAAGASAILAYAAAEGQIAIPPWSFWLTLALYPIWGVTQQFALQNLIARNVAGLVRRPVAVAGVAAVLFAASHVPRWPLVALTFVAGFFFTAIYRRVPNLWAVGLVHGILGSLAIYFVSGEDPGAGLWNLVVGL